MTCFDCGRPDWHNGQGDGIGSCDCPRCEWCGAPPGVCSCDNYDPAYDCPPSCNCPWHDDVPAAGDYRPYVTVELPAGDVA